MIVNSSQIRMDASSSHKDVSTTTSGKILSRNHSGRSDESFTLNLPDISSRSAKQDTATLNGTLLAASNIHNEGNEQQCCKNEQVLSKVIDELAGTKVQTDDSLKTDLETEEPSNQPVGKPGKRFYQIGGQQFSMFFAGHKVQTEYETMNFSSEGRVITADGRTVEFSLNLSMQRTSVIRESVLGRAASGYFIDPLVLHFDGGLQALSEQTFLFDLNGDGQQEAIPGLQQGSGFLALDIDGDGTIKSGNELFGPTSGSGFRDLSVHDLDENLWIDENDPIFSKLQVWMNASGGQQQLLSLKEAGVGAISLTNAGSLFNLKTSANSLLGQVTASGIFLTEDGAVKSLQDYNLALPEGQNETAKTIGTPESEQLLASLRSIISRQQDHLEILAQRQRNRLFKRQAPENLFSKFWQWQEKYDTNRQA